ncbi:hypothetical protein F4818DRAFT_196352 [Hypoxylon cercidicola]|nr:hypothetical protein F4818DRAFT_196352 [Hypoxylon cercidicola]
MVGVPGRSKGCNTCLRRRVKCSEERPSCQRCLKAGLECLGYVRNTQWRHISTASFTGASQSETKASLTKQTKFKSKPKVVSQIATGDWLERVRLSQGLDLAAFQDDFCFAFAFSNFVWRGYGAQWLAQAAQGKLGHLALDSTRALAQSYFGKAKGVPSIEIQGNIQYGKCLHGLWQELGEGKALAKGHELVVPILVLMMHASTLTDRAAARFHLKGVAKIIEVCGPKAFQRQPLLDALEAARATIIVASLVVRQRVFLEDPSWHSVPYDLDPSAKQPQSYLLDILTAVPGILEELSRAGDLAAARSSLLGLVRQKLTMLYRWRWHWQECFGSEVTAANRGCQFDEPFVKLLGSAGISRRFDQLNFARPATAADIMLYNAVLIWLLALMWDLEPFGADGLIEQCAKRARDSVVDKQATNSNEFSFGGPTTKLTSCSSFEPLRRPGGAVSVRDPAVEICRVFEWQSRHNHGMGDEANFIYMFPIGMAITVLDAEPRDRKWIHALLNANELTRGYGGYGRSHVRKGDGDGVDKISMRTSKADGPVVFGTGALLMRCGLEDERSSQVRRVTEFGFYVAREVEAQDYDHEEGRTLHPGLVHLLLLRGKNFIH